MNSGQQNMIHTILKIYYKHVTPLLISNRKFYSLSLTQTDKRAKSKATCRDIDINYELIIQFWIFKDST